MVREVKPSIIDDVTMVKVSNSDHFVKITDESGIYYGGDQDWFPGKAARRGACGTVAAANILTYMSKLNEKYKCLFKYDDFSKSNFLENMNDIYEYLAPYEIPFTSVPLGIWPVSKFARGVKKFANEQGLKIESVSLGSKAGKKEIVRYLIKALKSNLPVAMLIGYNTKMNGIKVIRPDNRYFIQPSMKLHWVTITEIHINKNTKKVTLKVSTWGGYCYLDLDDYIQGEKIYKGFVYFY